MTYGEIYDEICDIIFGNTPIPAFVYNRLHGSNGIISKKRKKLMEQEDLWFMEAEKILYIAEGITEYDINFSFKEEITLRFSSPATGDYQDPLIKIALVDIERCYTDYDRTAQYPEHYYLDFNTTSSYRKLNLFPIPAEFTDTVDLSTGTTAECIANTAFTYVLDGEDYDKAAAENTFSAADTINTGADSGIFWGIWLIQIDEDGTISTKPGGGLSDQVYTSELNAINALPEVDSGNWPVGYVTVAANTGASWTANTDDLTIGSDVSDVNYYNVTVLLHLKYWKFLDDLSDTNETFDATEDDISINCADLLIWDGVKRISEIRTDMTMMQIAMRNEMEETDAIVRKNFNYRNANAGRIPHKSL